MPYTGNIVYLNRRQLISDTNGNIYYLGKTWSQFGHVEENMDVYGVPNVSGSYVDSNGNGTYFPVIATNSCINTCYTFYVIGSQSQYSYLNCSSTLISSTFSNGQLFCAIDGTINKVGNSNYYIAEECGDLDSTILYYDYDNSDDFVHTAKLIITDVTLGIQILNTTYTGVGTVSVIDTHQINVNVTIGTSGNNTTSLKVEDSVVTLYDQDNTSTDESFTFTVNASRPEYDITASSWNNT